jgi:hypothetical protein
MAAQPLVIPTSDFIASPSGNWSTFAVSVGSPPQNFSMLLSTVDRDVLLPFYEDGVQMPRLFRSSDSTTWVASGPNSGTDIVTIGPVAQPVAMNRTVRSSASGDSLLGVIFDSYSDYGIPSQSYGYTAGAAYS